jgi:hypothetical protein
MDVKATFAHEAAKLKEACPTGVHLRIISTTYPMEVAQLRAIAIVQRETVAPVRLVSTLLDTLGTSTDFWLVYVKEA